MPRILNFQALVVDTVDINVTQSDGTVQTFHLKDDISTEIGVMILEQLQNEVSAGGDAAAKLRLVDGELTHICGEIFRHSYPEVTDEEIRSMLEPKDRVEIVMSFFQSLSARFRKPPSTSDSTTSSPAELETTTDPAETLPLSASSESTSEVEEVATTDA